MEEMNSRTGSRSQDGSPQPSYRPRPGTGLGFPRDRTVLLVIDPVNDFLSEGGAGWEMTKNTVRVHDVVGHLKQAIEGARASGVPVLFGPMAYTEEDYADGRLQCRCGINRIMFEKKMFLAGSWGADFHPDLRPRADEVVLLPHKGADVFETDLPERLERLGTTHLVIAGMTANLCCESTGRTAMERGYHVTFLSDAIGAENMIAYEAAVRVNYPLIANAVMNVDEFLAALNADGGDELARPGDQVVGSDRGEIGTVREVSTGNAEQPPYARVDRGVLHGDLFVPLDAIVNRSGGEIFINVPKLVAGKMPWDAPPTRQEQLEKTGPRAAQGSLLYGSRGPSATAGSAPPA